MLLVATTPIQLFPDLTPVANLVVLLLSYTLQVLAVEVQLMVLARAV